MFANIESSKFEKVNFFSVPASLKRKLSPCATVALPNASNASILNDVAAIPVKFEPSPVNEREDGYKAVKYDKLVSLLIEGVKELSKEVNDLKNKIGE